MAPLSRFCGDGEEETQSGGALSSSGSNLAQPPTRQTGLARLSEGREARLLHKTPLPSLLLAFYPASPSSPAERGSWAFYLDARGDAAAASNRSVRRTLPGAFAFLAPARHKRRFSASY